MNNINFLQINDKYFINGTEVNQQEYEILHNEFNTNPLEFMLKYEKIEDIQKKIAVDKHVQAKEFYDDEKSYHFVLQLKDIKNEPEVSYDPEKKVISIGLDSDIINFNVGKKINANISSFSHRFLNNILDIALEKKEKGKEAAGSRTKP